MIVKRETYNLNAHISKKNNLISVQLNKLEKEKQYI